MKTNTPRPISGDYCHAKLTERIKPRLGFDPSLPFDNWKNKVHEKLYELLGMEEIENNACPLQISIEQDETTSKYRLIRFVFDSEYDCTVPCYLLIPDQGKEKYPLAVGLQGHTTGFHISLGVAKYEGDEDYIEDNSIALQAIEKGYACLCIEQRALGERVSEKTTINGYGRCRYPALTAFMLGRTVIGERVWDVMRALDLVLREFDCIDGEKILITGNSGGGTASFYTACMDERIDICAPSCSFSPYKTSIMPMCHCPCNYIPHILKWFEMTDLACLIAPRYLIAAAGAQDGIFPAKEIEEGFPTVEKIYSAAGSPEKCRLIVTPEGHHWCKELMWDAIDNAAKNLGWFDN